MSTSSPAPPTRNPNSASDETTRSSPLPPKRAASCPAPNVTRSRPGPASTRTGMFATGSPVPCPPTVETSSAPPRVTNLIPRIAPRMRSTSPSPFTSMPREPATIVSSPAGVRIQKVPRKSPRSISISGEPSGSGVFPGSRKPCGRGRSPCCRRRFGLNRYSVRSRRSFGDRRGYGALSGGRGRCRDRADPPGARRSSNRTRTEPFPWLRSDRPRRTSRRGGAERRSKARQIGAPSRPTVGSGTGAAIIQTPYEGLRQRRGPPGLLHQDATAPPGIMLEHSTGLVLPRRSP